jgi:hypothetical protein
MSELDNIVNVTITAETSTPSQTGFGTPLVASYHTVFPERVRVYTSLSGMTSDGFTSASQAYRMATKIFSQNPSPTQIVVGRTENDQVMTVDITPSSIDLRASTAYTVYHNGLAATYTTDTTPTVAEITAGLAAAIDPTAWAISTAYAVGEYVKNDTGPVKIYVCTTAGTSAGSGGPTGTRSGIVDGTCVWDYVGPESNLTATDNTTKVTVAANSAADAFSLYAALPEILALQDITADGSPNGIVADITAIRAVNDEWYCLLPCNQGKAVLKAAAAHIETLDKTMICSSPDDDIKTTAIDDLASELQALSYDRTMLMWDPRANYQFPCGAWAGVGLPTTPGSITWAYKNLAGIAAPTLNATQITNLEGKDCNYYVTQAGLSNTRFGVVSGGSNTYFDVTRTIDWTKARIQEGVYGRLANLSKVPFTNRGRDVIVNEVWAVIREGQGNEAFALEPEPIVTAPDVSTVSAANKANRLYPDINFTVTLAGAIHKTTIVGVLQV